jgi:NAD(P)-dependent dehydrogenase (short-subunit alcohol dehydrogenase family)
MADRPVAIVTGASRGIGKAIAKELASLGYDLLVNHFDVTRQGTPDESFACQTQKQIKDLGARCEVLRGDVSSADDRIRLVTLVKNRFGRCDLLANNAGVAPAKRQDLLEATEESYDRVMGINLKGPYFLTQAVANWMVEQIKEYPDRKFRIVNIGSLSAD